MALDAKRTGPTVTDSGIALTGVSLLLSPFAGPLVA
jgi:hypothetical protein